MPGKAKGRGKKPATGKQLVITRVFDAPVEKVWRAWTDAEQVTQWFGPKVFTTPTCTIDLRVGGTYLYCMRSPDGKDYWGTGVYREIVPLKKLVYTDSFADEHGNVVPATHYGMSSEIPLEMTVSVAFENLGGKTRMTLRHVGIPVGPDREGAQQGWRESFDKLAIALAQGPPGTVFVTDRAKRQVVATRVFKAPRDRVFRVFTDPKSVPEWWGPRRLTTTVETMDVRPGGRWRFLQRESDGTEYAFHGEYREVVPPERLVFTFEFEGMPGHVLLATVTLDDVDGGTKMTVRAQFETVGDLEENLKVGMTSGWAETDDRLEELLSKM